MKHSLKAGFATLAAVVALVPLGTAHALADTTLPTGTVVTTDVTFGVAPWQDTGYDPTGDRFYQTNNTFGPSYDGAKVQEEVYFKAVAPYVPNTTVTIWDLTTGQKVQAYDHNGLTTSSVEVPASNSCSATSSVVPETQENWTNNNKYECYASPKFSEPGTHTLQAFLTFGAEPTTLPSASNPYTLASSPTARVKVTPWTLDLAASRTSLTDCSVAGTYCGQTFTSTVAPTLRRVRTTSTNYVAGYSWVHPGYAYYLRNVTTGQYLSASNTSHSDAQDVFTFSHRPFYSGWGSAGDCPSRSYCDYQAVIASVTNVNDTLAVSPVVRINRV